MATTATADKSLPQRVKHFYERISSEGAAAMPELEELYSSDIHFINPVVDEVGLAAFQVQWQKALKSYKLFQFHDIVVIGTDEFFTMTYSMSLKFAIGPVFKSNMATDCHGRDGKVYLCRDYFDVVGSLVQPFPPFAWLYKKVFGLIVA